jgi:hypothetical protein
MALFFLIIGVKVVLTKRPIFLPSRYFFVFLLFAISPQFVNTASMLRDDISEGLSFILLLNPVMYICLIIFSWIQMRGYMAIGVTGESFRKALHYSLDKNDIQFEEQLSAIKLTSLNASLQVAIQSWIGAGQLKLKQSHDNKLLSNIVSDVNEYFVEYKVKPNNITSVFYIVMGIFMFVSAGTFFSLLS